jgi:ketosteroid isomerase-like protein
MTTHDELAAFNERFSAALATQCVDAVVDLYTDDARLSCCWDADDPRP